MFDNFMRVVTSFDIIIYTRLSKEEQGKSKEDQSKSIINQLEICHKYILEEQKSYPNCQFRIVAKLKDDGVSGTTFERDDFKELVKLIESKKANMVITKDLSRLGRDHIKTDDYIEKWFPEHNVRYVAIMESVDTYTDNVSNDIAPIINWSNDHFAKQTSKKIKKQFDILRKEGKWTGGEPPIGYQMNPNQKYQFIIEPKGAEIVKYIFTLAKQNKSLAMIANILTLEKIPIPTIIKGSKRKLNQNLLELWSSDTVREILQNEMYLGHMIQGKTTRLNHKSKTIVYLPKEQWIKVENKHTPIIDQQTFDIVQLLIQSNKNKTGKTYDYLLKGMIKCKECHHSISIQHYKNRKVNYTICNYYRKYGSKKKVCTAHRFVYEELEKLVLENIKKECFQSVDNTNFIDQLKNKEKNQQSQIDLNKKIKKCNREIWKVKQQMDTIYEDKLNGILDEEQYVRLVKSKQTDLELEEKKLRRFQSDFTFFQKNNTTLPDYEKIIQDFLSLKKPNKIIITKLIDMIYLSENGTINIHYKVAAPF